MRRLHCGHARAVLERQDILTAFYEELKWLNDPDAR